MSIQSHKRYIEQKALQEAQKAIDRSGRTTFKREDFASLRIQTVEPWKRVILAMLGVLFGVGGFYALKGESGWLPFFLFMLGSFAVLAAFFGIRKTVKAALNGVDPFYLFDALF